MVTLVGTDGPPRMLHPLSIAFRTVERRRMSLVVDGDLATAVCELAGGFDIVLAVEGEEGGRLLHLSSSRPRRCVQALRSLGRHAPSETLGISFIRVGRRHGIDEEGQDGDECNKER